MFNEDRNCSNAVGAVAVDAVAVDAAAVDGNALRLRIGDD
jgi:hypothetical protein